MEVNSGPFRNLNNQDFLDQLQLDLKKSSPDQTETTEISSISAEEFRFDPQTYSSLSPDRFKSKIPADFMCQICFNVVKDPQECVTCETIFCTNCIYTIQVCPSGCSKFEFKNISKFASKQYYSLTLTCKSQPFGCNFFSTLERVLEHEEKCDFLVRPCDNMLCHRYVFNLPKEDTNDPALCSEICYKLVEFSTKIDEENDLSAIENFKSCLEKCKRLAEEEVREELSQKISKIDEYRKEKVKFWKKRDVIVKEIAVRQNTTHPGKWNIRSCKWTCCGNSEVSSIGCKVLTS